MTDSAAPDKFETSLHRNPFWVLRASTRDDRQRIVELADEKALVLDADVCQKARADLTNPRARLSAEIAWLPGVSPARAWQIATAVREGFVEPLLDAGLPPLPRANILSAAFEVLLVDTSTTEITDRILALAKSAEEIDAETVLRSSRRADLGQRTPCSDLRSSYCGGRYAVAFISATEIACSSSSCVDGFHRFSISSRSSDRRPSCVGIVPVSAGTGVGNPGPLEVGRRSKQTYVR
jgi:hypothetical protein